jgi:hypothetical protein
MKVPSLCRYVSFSGLCHLFQFYSTTHLRADVRVQPLLVQQAGFDAACVLHQRVLDDASRIGASMQSVLIDLTVILKLKINGVTGRPPPVSRGGTPAAERGISHARRAAAIQHTDPALTARPAQDFGVIHTVRHALIVVQHRETARHWCVVQL